MKTFIHNVQVPPLTDTNEMLGMYRGLFDALQIPHEIPFPLVEAFTHPIEAENKKLVTDFFNSMMIMKQTLINKVNVKVSNVKVNSVMLTFIINFNEP